MSHCNETGVDVAVSSMLRGHGSGTSKLAACGAFPGLKRERAVPVFGAAERVESSDDRAACSLHGADVLGDAERLTTFELRNGLRGCERSGPGVKTERKALASAASRRSSSEESPGGIA